MKTLPSRRRRTKNKVDTREGQLFADEQPAAAETWLTGLNALRLVLGTRLDVREDQPPSVNPQPTERRDAAVYVYLSYLQEQLVEAIACGLDPNAP
jgi:hypothetical protein